MVEDVEGEIVLFHDTLLFLQRYAEDEHSVTITVPMFEPVPPNYYISVVSLWVDGYCMQNLAYLNLVISSAFIGTRCVITHVSSSLFAYFAADGASPTPQRSSGRHYHLSTIIRWLEPRRWNWKSIACKGWW
jgi:hypothetical protein